MTKFFSAVEPFGFIYAVLVGMVLSFGHVASANQSQQVGAISGVEFRGLSATSNTLAVQLAGLGVGDLATEATLVAAVNRLKHSGRFISVTHQLETQDDGGVLVIIEVVEKRVVTAIRFEGQAKLSDGQLQNELTFKVGDDLDWFAIREGREAIVARYRDLGYGDVAVTFARAEIGRAGEVVYVIQEGIRVVIREVAYEGNTAFDVGQLKKKVESKTAWWIIRTGALDPSRVDADVVNLRRFYRDEGFFDAQVTFRIDVREDKNIRLVFVVEEGARYTIEQIQFMGLTVFSQDELSAEMASRVSEIARRPRIEADARLIREKYGTIGYIHAAVRVTRVFSDDPGLVRVTYHVEEGEQFRVGRIAVRGNARTKDKVVRRALDLYPPGDLLDLSAARNAEKQLMQSRIFSSARVYPVGDLPGVRDVVMDVQEAERLGDFIFGVGVTSNSGLVGTVTLDLRNFDLYDPPTSWEELYKFKSFFGAGQRMRIELQPGTNVSRFRIDFTEPYLFDKPVRFDYSAYLFSRGREGYGERRIGSTVSFGKRFDRGQLRGWTSELAFRVEDVRLDQFEVFTARAIREDQGSNLITSLKGSLVRDRTDNRFKPSSGDRLRLSLEQFGILGGDHNFAKMIASYRWYKTLHTDSRERKHVLQLRSEGGAIIGDAPVFERFFTGGTGSVRGFNFRGIGPHEGIDRNNVGGDFLVLLGAEYSYPLFGDNVRGHVFLDSGTVDTDVYRAAVGFGVRLTLDVFGPVPLEFNIAVPMLSDADDDVQVFSFVVGGLF